MEDSQITWPCDLDLPNPESSPRRFISGIRRANRRIFQMAQRDKALTGMGTTFAGLLVLENSAVIAHVGDSRVYRLRDGRLELLTSDHSLANEYVRLGLLSVDDVATFSQRNVITRAVGVHEMVDVDVKITDRRPGDVFLLSTDGLHGEIDDREIEAILLADPEPCIAAARLIHRANEAGGSDNITVVLVRFPESA